MAPRGGLGSLPPQIDVFVSQSRTEGGEEDILDVAVAPPFPLHLGVHGDGFLSSLLQ
ncbi:hypothetical protein CDL15_Pgr004820 [Punica granatum]|uniref:Uncharacterized protein n=1 Tax=Punica granatum TaxID=22663 RepID=A0A218W783_PUNGR|nr:hypothetical protein CDL15_Pgr004820 [Punica granatum]